MFPTSRPTLPIGNSTAPENMTEPSSPWVHLASEGPAAPQTFDPGSSSRKEPFPEPRASKRKERLSPFRNVTSTFQLPMKFEDCTWDKPTPNIWANTIKINAGFGVTITASCRFASPNLFRSRRSSIRNLREYSGGWHELCEPKSPPCSRRPVGDVGATRQSSCHTQTRASHSEAATAARANAFPTRSTPCSRRPVGDASATRQPLRHTQTRASHSEAATTARANAFPTRSTPCSRRPVGDVSATRQPPCHTQTHASHSEAATTRGCMLSRRVPRRPVAVALWAT